jgi:hypothetical protein
MERATGRLQAEYRMLARDAVWSMSLGEYLDHGRYSLPFRDWYLVPMAAAIWSSPPRDILDFLPPTFAPSPQPRLLRIADRRSGAPFAPHLRPEDRAGLATCASHPGRSGVARRQSPTAGGRALSTMTRSSSPAIAIRRCGCSRCLAAGARALGRPTSRTAWSCTPRLLPHCAARGPRNFPPSPKMAASGWQEYLINKSAAAAVRRARDRR